MFKSYLEYLQEGVEYEDMPRLAQDDYNEAMELRRQEKYDREHRGEEEEYDDEYDECDDE